MEKGWDLETDASPSFAGCEFAPVSSPEQWGNDKNPLQGRFNGGRL